MVAVQKVFFFTLIVSILILFSTYFIRQNKLYNTISRTDRGRVARPFEE